MRTTVEINDQHRAKLLELAARRGEKGFSRIVAEAIEAYLAESQENEAVRREALKMRGRFSSKEADRLLAHVAEVRKSWR